MLAKTEDAMIERCKRVIGDQVKTIKDLPGGWDEATLKAARRDVPGIYIAWSGGAALAATKATLNSGYAVYVVTGQASGERERRRGNTRQIGAYEVLECIVPALHGFQIKDVGSLQLQRVDNLFSDRVDQLGVIVYGAVFNIKQTFPAPLDAGQLANFETFHVNSKVPNGPDTETHLDLPTQ